jgi:hypothetical protein
VPGSNIDGFPSTDTCASTTQIIVLFETKCIFLAHENPDWQAVFLSKTNSILKVKHVLDAPLSKVDGVFFEKYMCFFNSAE